MPAPSDHTDAGDGRQVPSDATVRVPAMFAPVLERLARALAATPEPASGDAVSMLEHIARVCELIAAKAPPLGGRS